MEIFVAKLHLAGKICGNVIWRSAAFAVSRAAPQEIKQCPRGLSTPWNAIAAGYADGDGCQEDYYGLDLRLTCP